MIYVVDAACPSRFEDSKSALGNILGIQATVVILVYVISVSEKGVLTFLSGIVEKALRHEDLQGAPVLILANKQVIYLYALMKPCFMILFFHYF